MKSYEETLNFIKDVVLTHKNEHGESLVSICIIKSPHINSLRFQNEEEYMVSDIADTVSNDTGVKLEIVETVHIPEDKGLIIVPLCK